jgi:hypothetical protein
MKPEANTNIIIGNTKTQKNNFIFAILLFLILISISAAYAETYAEIREGPAKTSKDPLFIEMQSNVHQMMPVKAKVYINDPLIKKEAKYIEIAVGSSVPYSLTQKIYFDPSGIFRQTMPYNGEDTIDFGFRPYEYHGQTSAVSVSFYKIKKVPGKEWPDTSSPDSEFKRYECHIETNKLLCSEKDGCIVCNFYLGSVIKEYQVSKSIDSVSPPSRFTFVNAKDSDQNLKDYAPQYESFSYAEDKKITDSRGNENSYTDAYSISLDFSNNAYLTLKENKEYMLNFLEKQKGMVVSDIPSPGGITGGYAFEGLAYTPPSGNGREYDYVSLTYEIYAELVPAGSGYMKVTASRSTVVPVGSAGSEKDRVISEAKAFAASYRLSEGEISKPSRELMHTYYVRGEVKPQEETTELSLFGTVANRDANPLPFVELEAIVGGKSFPGRTDANGDFKILLTGLKLKDGEEAEAKLRVLFNYERDGKKYFSLFVKKNGNNYAGLIGAKKFKIKGGENYELNLKFDDVVDPDMTTSVNPVENLKHYAVIYYHMHEAVEFALKKLNAVLDYKLPIEIYIGNTQGDTLYSPTDSEILIAASTAGYGSTDRPDNREYHEFSHGLMYDVYGEWPADRGKAGTINHDGLINPSTADSYLEGFAEFLAMVMSKDYGEKDPDIYASFGSMEVNYHPWDNNGLDEEFAVASLLWDMYDDKNDEGDALTMSIDDIWAVLKVKRNNFYEYYKAFKDAYPKKAKDIEALFIQHGFFADTQEGNKVWDAFEPIRDTNKNGNRDANELFVDLGAKANLSAEIKYNKGEEIGKAADYQRLNRTNAVRIPNAYLKVEDTQVKLYKITVEGKENYEYVADVREGLLYVQPLPDGYDAKITIAPYSRDYAAQRPYIITNNELHKKIQDAKDGYFSAHKFTLIATGKKEDKEPEMIAPATYKYAGDIGKEVKINISDEDKEFSVPILPIIIIIIIGGLGFAAYKMKGAAGSLHSHANKAIEKFKEKGMPAIKDTTQKAMEIAKETAKQISHHTKKAYEKAKPHVKKAALEIKKNAETMIEKISKK